VCVSFFVLLLGLWTNAVWHIERAISRGSGRLSVVAEAGSVPARPFMDFDQLVAGNADPAE
jgi:hypothetical protein